MTMKHKIIILPLGFGDPGNMSQKVLNRLKTAEHLILRTRKHAITGWLETCGMPFNSFDSLYENAVDFDSLSSAIAASLWEMAEGFTVTYAVSDPLTDESVSAILAAKPAGANVEIIPGPSVSDLYLPSILPYLPEADLRILSAEQFRHVSYYPDESLLLIEVDNPLLAGEVKLHLSGILGDDQNLIFMRDETSAVQISLFELDRQPEYDHRSAVFIPRCPIQSRNRYTLNDLPYLIDKAQETCLTRCPDDSPHLSVTPSLQATAGRCTDAISQNDPEALKSALGDLLFQSLVHASVAERYDEFTLGDVLSSLFRRTSGEKCEKNG